MRPEATGPALWQGATAEPQFQPKADGEGEQCQQLVEGLWAQMGSRDFGQGTQMGSVHSSGVMGTAAQLLPLLRAHPWGTPASTRQAEFGVPKPISVTAGLCLPLSPVLTVPLTSPPIASLCMPMALHPPFFPPEPHLSAVPSLEPCWYSRLSPPPGWGSLSQGLRTVPTPPPPRIWHIAGTERGSDKCLPPPKEAPTKVLEKQGGVRRSPGRVWQKQKCSSV